MKSIYFFCVGLNVSLCAQATWKGVEHWIKARKSGHIDLVDFGLPFCDRLPHVINLEPSIALVKSNG